MSALPTNHCCPFCDIAARAPPRLNRSVLSNYNRQKGRRNGGGGDGGAEAAAAAAASAAAAAPPALMHPPAPPPQQLLLPLVYADRRVVAFVDRSPAAVQHLLVCPRAHVPNVNTLLDAAARGRRVPLPPSPPRAGAGEEEEGGDDDDDGGDGAISPADLADHMRAVGEALLWQRSRRRDGNGENGNGSGSSSNGGGGAGEDASRPALPPHLFGFHVPPWRSVDHLHLHCIEPPFSPPALEVKYTLEWLNWLPDDRLRARLRGGGDGSGDGGGGRPWCCWPPRRRGREGGLRGNAAGREPLVPAPPRPSSAP